MIGDLDVREVLQTVRAPTLVLHRTGNRWWDVRGARWMAERIEGAEFVELPGVDNYWWAGDADAIIDEIERFLLGARRSVPSDRELATIMFTDIVDSTGLATRLGDAAWRTQLDAHDRVLRREVERYGGHVIKNLGDGFLLTFDGPARAIRAADALRAAVAATGLTLRIAIHTGEVERRGDDIGGVAVHLAARVLQAAEPGEILTTGVVRGLVAGSGLRFVDRGRRRLRGLEEEWDLHRVEGLPA